MFRHCSQLTSLELSGCTGPFTDVLGEAFVGHRPPAYKLQELVLSWGAGHLTDAGLAALLHPDRAALRTLVLKGCSSLSDAAWHIVAQHHASLQCLHVENCGALPKHTKSGMPSSGANAPMTAAAAEEALSTCEQLIALTIAITTLPWSAAEVERLRAGCTALQTLHLV